MTPCEHNACAEYQAMQLSRRQFLGTTAGAAVLASAPAWLPRVAMATSHRSAAADVIVSIYLRGGCDGLSLCAPYNETNLADARPNLFVLPPGIGLNHSIDLSATAPSPTAPGGTVAFGFHPAMQPMMHAFNNDHLLVVHATGMTNSNKSHFDSQRYMEIGRSDDPRLISGWLGRHLASTSASLPSALIRGVAMTDGLPRTLSGGPLTLPVPDLASDPGPTPALNNFTGYRLSGTTATSNQRLTALRDLYQLTSDPFRGAAQNVITTMALLNQIGASGYTPAGGTVYPQTDLGFALKSTAALLNADVGVEAIAIDYGGWDTHLYQGFEAGSIPGTTLWNQLSTLAAALSAFYHDAIETRYKKVIVTVMSEFGRRVGENGTLGTDHGYATTMLVMGRAVNGGRVLTNWPGIGDGQPATDVDLQVTIDYRHILAEIVAGRLGNPNLGVVFPGFTPISQGVLL